MLNFDRVLSALFYSFDSNLEIDLDIFMEIMEGYACIPVLAIRIYLEELNKLGCIRINDNIISACTLFREFSRHNLKLLDIFDKLYGEPDANNS